jgi:hypothetical protein
MDIEFSISTPEMGDAVQVTVVCQCAGKPLMIKVDAGGGLPA